MLKHIYLKSKMMLFFCLLDFSLYFYEKRTIRVLLLRMKKQLRSKRFIKIKFLFTFVKKEL